MARIARAFFGPRILAKLAGQKGRKMVCRSLVLGILAALCIASAQAAPLPRYGSFVFSGLCSYPDTGKVIGSRLTVLRSDHDDVVYYEWSELFEPGRIVSFPGDKNWSPASFGTKVAHGLRSAAAKAVRIEPSGRMTAIFASGNPPKTVAGELSADGFMMSGFEARIWVPRQRVPGAKIPDCKLPP